MKKLGSILIEQGVITDDQLQVALREQRRLGGRLGTVLTELGMVNDDDVARAIAHQSGVEHVTLDDEKPDPEAIALVPESLARKSELIPLSSDGSTLVVAMANPTDIVAIDEVQKATDLFVSVRAATDNQIALALNRAYRAQVDSRFDEVVKRALRAVSGEGAREEGVIELVDFIIEMAIRVEATDLHLEPEENALRVRFRVDGDLMRGPTIPGEVSQPIVTRIKIMANLNIAESRMPQDGKIAYVSSGREVDLRISTFPSILGESVVVRILDRNRAAMPISDLGLSSSQSELMRRAAARPNGLILVTGPTGSGKTTTLYALLRAINSLTRKTITLEDPVEYRLSQVTQCQINERAGITFSSGLRSILRHDPDVILVGEMRDGETASVAIRAALTGHLVLSTLHTNDAVRTIARLRDLEVEPYLIGSSLLIVVAQRLVHTLCPSCRFEHQPMEAEFEVLGIEEGFTCWESYGCPECNYRGVTGRSALFEVLEVTPEIHSLILSDADEGALRECAARSGYASFHDSALERARAGEISLSELGRVTAGVLDAPLSLRGPRDRRTAKRWRRDRRG